MQCDFGWRQRIHLKRYQALSKTGHSIASSMGNFTEIMSVKAMRI